MSRLGAVLILVSSSDAAAQTAPPTPSTAGTASVVLWYRSSEGCPDGSSFLASIGNRAAHVRLAEAGDRVDFVVNLALTKEGAWGRLERETESGTVAIRDVEDVSCAQVAEVIALNLSLALDPAGAEPTLTEQPPVQEEPLVQGEPQTTGSPASEKNPPSHKPFHGSKERGASRDDNDNDATMRSGLIRVGAQGGALSGVASGPLPRVAAFLQAEGLLSWAPELSVRFAAVGARGSSVTSIGAIRQGYWAGRLEICPVSFGGKGAFLSPCAAGELGQIWASGSLSDSALWGALGAHARGVWALSPRFALEADLGAHFLLNKYELVAGSTTLLSSAPVGVLVNVGVSFAF